VSTAQLFSIFIRSAIVSFVTATHSTSLSSDSFQRFTKSSYPLFGLPTTISSERPVNNIFGTYVVFYASVHLSQFIFCPLDE
jgi:hypothetical protein